MTTKQEAPTIDRLLIKRRDELGHYQTNASDAIGVSRNSYRQWETGHSVPEDEWVKPLMEYLDMTEQQVVMTLYRSREARRLRPDEVVPLTAPLGRLDITWNTGVPPHVESGEWSHRPIDAFPKRRRLKVA